MKIVNIEAFPIRVKNDFDIGRKADTKNINTAMLEVKDLEKRKVNTAKKYNQVEKRNLEPLGKIVSWASCGVDPALMGSGPIPSSNKALKLANWSINDLDLVESNEAFAAQSLAVIKELNIPEEIVNVNGGAIALGHPIGASGCRIVVTLLHEMKRRNSKKGLATLCIGGGMGIAMCLERD